MTISEGDVARSSSRVANSEENVAKDEEGGRYTVRRIKVKGVVVRVVLTRTQRDSKEE